LNLYSELGGAENALRALLAALDPERFRPFVVLASEGPLAASLRAAGIECVVVPFPARPLWNLALPWVLLRQLQVAGRLRALVRDRGIRILHVSDVLGLLLAVPAVGAGARLVYQVNYFGAAPRRFLWRRVARRYAARILVFSEAQRLEIAAAAPELAERTSVIPVGIEAANPGESPQAVRRHLGIPEAAPLVAMFARFDAMKGHATFLLAAREIRASLPEVAFAIVGGALNAAVLPHVTRVRDAVLRQREALGLAAAVRVTGFVPDIAAVMGACSVVVCPSVREPFGLVVVEAMAAGAAVVVSDSGGPAEIVEDGRSGLHFRTGDPASLAQAVLRLLRDPPLRERLAAGGRSRAAVRYTRTQYARSMESLYASLA
jgi:glycosyltransferase involved in cell wall biosynthesis